ncbi:hypothetical protein TWF694_007309 [Orbilia ellipsospora]|uniref:Uncharacterized protein n=1 Tax=Orbilia ellipsospora TaxID=2528407 RepID=A0AAV9XHS7_9PEZI
MKSPVASLLWRSLRIYQIFGANTDVGKTIFTTLLARTAKRLWRDEEITYLKPVSTGAEDEADDRHISRFAPGVSRHTLYQYDIPCSPHKAAIASGKSIPADEEFLSKCRDFAALCAAKDKGWLFMETAGGVHSPGPSGKTQADLYIPLRTPSVLIGDSRLGGISQTISAFESLRIRGYDVDHVLLFNDDVYENYKYLGEYFDKNYSIPVSSLLEPPKRHDNPRRDAEALEEYYSREDSGEVVSGVLEALKQSHCARLSNLDSMATRASQHIWYPFTQQSLVGPRDITTIDSAYGDFFQTLTPKSADGPIHDSAVLKSSFDASASWWTQGLGHANSKLTLAAAYAAGRYGHVIFASTIHQPAMLLAETLLKGMKNPRLNRVFYSDNGSTGMEVAIKMGLRATRKRYGWEVNQNLKILGLKGAYHGDTIGAMDCADPGIYNEKVEWYEGKGYWLDYPTVLCKHGKWSVTVADGLQETFGQGKSYKSLDDIFDVEAREERGEHKLYEEHIISTLQKCRERGVKFGVLILEPIVLGAGGMEFVDPLFQRTLVNVVRSSPHLFGEPVQRASEPANDLNEWTGLPVVFDEVFTGLYRLGRITPSTFLGVYPDISVHAKLLTGGLVPLCATIASENIYKTFLSPDKTDALLHGHSYTAHPIGCQVALESIQEMQAMDKQGEWDWARFQGWGGEQKRTKTVEVWSIWSHEFIKNLSKQTDRVVGAWALGTVLAIHLRDNAGAGYSSNVAIGLRDALSLEREGESGGPWNVHCRVLGNVLYIMGSQVSSETSVKRISELLTENLANH